LARQVGAFAHLVRSIDKLSMAPTIVNGGTDFPGGRIRFGNLDFVPSSGVVPLVNPIFVPTQAFRFGSLEFIIGGSDDPHS
jgi:hypothetical protein